MSGVASAKCPVCGTPITQTQYAEIQERIRTEEQAKLAVQAEELCARHEAELKIATAAAAANARHEAEQKLAQSQIKEAQQADRIRQLEINQTTLQAEATKAQQQLRAQFEKDLKVATDKAANDVRRDAEQKLAAAQVKETQQAGRIRQLETNETTLRADAVKEQEKLKGQFANDLKAATAQAAIDARRGFEQKLADAQLKEQQHTERISKLEADAATQRANASRAQEQFANDLKAAVENATKDARAAAVNELNAKDAELRALTESHAEELKQQRRILDEYRDGELLKLRNEHTRENEALQKKVQDLTRQLEQKTANELGDGPEIDLHQALKEAFPGDNIYRVKRGQPGVDVIHQVMHNGQHCQTIVYDSKNHRQYRHSFIEKLLVDKAAAGAEHAVLVTSVFPSGERDLCIVDGVVLAKPLQAVTVAAVLRDRIINDHLRNLSFKDRTQKKERLYKLMTSEMFRQRMSAVEHAIEELEQIDVDEQKEHRKVWTARTARYRTAHKSVTDLVIEVNVILQGDGPAGEVVAVAVGVSATGTDDAVPFDEGDDHISF